MIIPKIFCNKFVIMLSLEYHDLIPDPNYDRAQKTY